MITTFTVRNMPVWALVRTGKVPAEADMIVVSDGNRVISISHSLSLAGGERGEPVERLVRRFPTAHVVPRDPAVEVLAWEGLLERLHRETPRLYFEEEGRCSSDIRSIAVIESLTAELGASVGVGPDLRTSELASFGVAPGNVEVVTTEDVSRWTGRRPVGLLSHYRFPTEMIERLDLLGLSTFASLRRLSKRHLTAQWGAEGERLWRFLRAEPRYLLPLYTPLLRIIRRHRFESDVLEPYEWEADLRRLCEELVAELGERVPSFVVVRLDEGDLQGVEEHSFLLPRPEGRVEMIERPVRSLLLRRNPPAPFARLELSLGGIRNAAWRQGSLFDRRPELAAAVRRILRRWPRGLLRVARIDPDEHLPEERVRTEAMRVEDLEGR